MTDTEALKFEIQQLTEPHGTTPPAPTEVRGAVARLFRALEEGSVRAAVPETEGGFGAWKAVPWVKSGILLAFRVGVTRRVPGTPADFFDRDTLPLHPVDGEAHGVRIVPGGSSVRAGAHLASGVVIMPPAYVNVGAWVGEGAMVDSHALVGSCAQIGARVHLSAGAQIGGVLEPVGLRPVVVEEEAMVGGNCGVFEGVLVGRRAVLAPGVQLSASTPVYDLVREEVYRGSRDAPLSIPEGAVVVPGSRPLARGFGAREGLHLYAPVIVKYRDERTDSATILEEALR
ncbi:MAG: 2,3,4,5-tetrahydropyridine-2,6-dicarboxylate N-succinyltransferase [Gemmatimonadota bacterium]